ncbi:chemotaxis protein methyltransferase [Terrihabitans soli]|uniref:protein-glutamate O-methyltransferase n=1 Tax=Terrihabitans soli TaxID=708113 RepID=A0A6S6QIC9_9HYPH|nr:protein-glutamate O-methyltransferase CheR [Terrihabitans soli]BCJ89974.1 chemotaxis protein methyltransferase [Terrihabitans soli]
MTPADLEFLGKFLKERSGLVLVGDKTYLIESRLMPIARKHNMASLAVLMQQLRAGSPNLEGEVVEAMTTNETFFFRDKLPFDLFTETMLPAMIQQRSSQRRLRIWCAACSTGQEPYSLAMLLEEQGAKLAGWNIEILATDLSGEVLTKAKAGRFSQFEVQRGLPIQLLVKNFEQVGDLWELSQKIRSKVTFRPINLLRDFGPLGTFDIIFCRNVLIYFDEQTKVDILNRLSASLAPDGFLVLGAAETVVGLCDRFKSVPDKRGMYIRNMAADAARQPMRIAVGATR